MELDADILSGIPSLQEARRADAVEVDLGIRGVAADEKSCRNPKAATCSRNGSGAVAAVGSLGKSMCITAPGGGLAVRSRRGPGDPVPARTG